MEPVKYMKDFFGPTYAAIKRASPDAKIMLGNPAGGIGGVDRLVLACLGEQSPLGIKDGRLLVHGGDVNNIKTCTLVVAEKLSLKDVAVEVDARNEGQSGIDMALPNTRLERAWGIDLFNGTEQELILAADGANTVLPKIVVKDYPTYLRVMVKADLQRMKINFMDASLCALLRGPEGRSSSIGVEDACLHSDAAYSITKRK
jgi:hypothetical protein